MKREKTVKSDSGIEIDEPLILHSRLRLGLEAKTQEAFRASFVTGQALPAPHSQFLATSKLQLNS